MRKFITLLFCCLLLCTTAEAKITADEETSTITYTSESITYTKDYSYGSGSSSYLSRYYNLSPSYYTHGSYTNDQRHACPSCKAEGNYSLSTTYTLPDNLVVIKPSYGSTIDGPSIFIAGNSALNTSGVLATYHNSFIGTLGSSGYRLKTGATAVVHHVPQVDVTCRGTHLPGCTRTDLTWGIRHFTREADIICYNRDDVEYYSNNGHTVPSTDFSKGMQYSTVVFRGCKTANTTIPSTSFELQINGGTYSGGPAINNPNAIVNTGTFTDTSGSSFFTIGLDSEQTVTTSDNKTITTVKLSNPPVIIDWADFPG